MPMSSRGDPSAKAAPLSARMPHVGASTHEIVSIGLLGFVMASVVVRFRAGWAVGNMFEYPVWLVTGLLIPVALLPGWVEPISWVLAPTWGMRALSDTAFASGSPFVDIGMCLLLSVVYTVLGALLLGRFLESARRRATLSLT